MEKYPNRKNIQNKIASEGTARLTFHASEMNDIIHPYSVAGYEYLSGEFVDYLDRFRTLLPKKMPIVLEVTGKQFNNTEKEIIDKAIWTHYGLYLSEASQNLKKTRIRMALYLSFMILSSSLLFLVSGATNEVVTNYGYVLFWFFGYRLLIHLILNYQPINREYQWYRRLSSLKLIFPDDENQILDAKQLSKEVSHYSKEADNLIRKHHFVEHVLMEESCVSLGCKIDHVEDAVIPSGAGDMEIISSEMADYIMSALPFIRQKEITKLTIEGNHFSEEEQNRIIAALRNYLAFTISEQEAEHYLNKGTSITFAIGLLISTILLFGWGKKVDLAVHEFFLVLFWFFADYFLEFVILSRKEIKYQKKSLEKLANMDISFSSPGQSGIYEGYKIR